MDALLASSVAIFSRWVYQLTTFNQQPFVMRDKTQVLSTASHTLGGSHPVWTLQTLERHLGKGRELR